MKRKQMPKKLSLNKITVARLDNREIETVKGGIIPIVVVVTFSPSNCICTEFKDGTCLCTRPDVC